MVLFCCWIRKQNFIAWCTFKSYKCDMIWNYINVIIFLYIEQSWKVLQYHMKIKFLLWFWSIKTFIMTSVSAPSSAHNIMPPEFFNSLMGSSSIPTSTAGTSSHTVTNSKGVKDETSVTSMTAAALSSAVRNMLSSEFLRQKWLNSQR